LRPRAEIRNLGSVMQRVSVVGTSGSGKSTLARELAHACQLLGLLGGQIVLLANVRRAVEEPPSVARGGADQEPILAVADRDHRELGLLGLAPVLVDMREARSLLGQHALTACRSQQLWQLRDAVGLDQGGKLQHVEPDDRVRGVPDELPDE
jgi:hypothetical protein